MAKIYTHYYNDAGEILMFVEHTGDNRNASPYPSFDLDYPVNSETHRYNTETNTVEPVE